MAKKKEIPKVTAETNQRDKPEMRLAGKEKGMIALFLILLIALTLKSNLFDEVKNLSPEEQQFKDFVDYSVARDYDGFLDDAHLMRYRVFDIEMADEDQKAVLRYEDPKTGDMTEVIQEGRYEAGVRGYFLWILPIRQFSVTAEIEE